VIVDETPIFPTTPEGKNLTSPDIPAPNLEAIDTGTRESEHEEEWQEKQRNRLTDENLRVCVKPHWN
jgi:hypothetical protein